MIQGSSPETDIVTMLTHTQFIIENMGPLIRQTRLLRGQTVNELAARSGLAPATINRLEAQSVKGDVRTMLKIIKWLLND